MIAPLLDGPDPVRSRLRTAVAEVDRQLSLLRSEDAAASKTTAADGLLARWADVIELLALGPEPEVRECPYCGHKGMRAATRCGHCWAKLTPPSTASTARSHGP